MIQSKSYNISVKKMSFETVVFC